MDMPGHARIRVHGRRSSDSVLLWQVLECEISTVTEYCIFKDQACAAKIEFPSCARQVYFPFTIYVGNFVTKASELTAQIRRRRG